jgi:hypothetical protein
MAKTLKEGPVNQHHFHPYEDNEGGVWDQYNKKRAEMDLAEADNDEKEEQPDKSSGTDEIPVEPKKVELTDEDKKAMIQIIKKYKGKRIPQAQIISIAQTMDVQPNIIDNFVYGLALKYIMTFKKKEQPAQ